jgi:hypothetical protein
MSPILLGGVLSLTGNVVVAEDVSLDMTLLLDCEGCRFWDFDFNGVFLAVEFSGLMLGGLLLSDEEMFRSS